MQSIYPVLKYEDAHAAIDFLERAFGFDRHAVYEGENGGVAHAELRLGDEYVMLGSAGEGDPSFNSEGNLWNFGTYRPVRRRPGRARVCAPAARCARPPSGSA